MSSYQKLKQKLEALEKQIEAARAKEIEQVVRDIRATMDLYRLTPVDLETPAERARRLGPAKRAKLGLRLGETTEKPIGHLPPQAARAVGRPLR